MNKYLKLILFALGLFATIYWTVEILRSNLFFKNVIQFLVIWAGIADAYKYSRLRQKIVRVKSSKSVSRMFAIIAIICDVIFVLYTLLIRDPFLIFVRGLALYTTIDLYYHVYLYYPFKTRKLNNFKKPSLWAFLVNTLEPNSTRQRL